MSNTYKEFYSIAKYCLSQGRKAISMSKNYLMGTSLIVKWIRIHLSMQQTQVPSLWSGKILHATEQLSP